MLQFALKKLIQGVLMVLFVSVITFGLLSTAGGDALTGLRDNPQVSPQTIADLEKLYNLDRSLPERYAGWLGGAVRAELGESFLFRVPVRDLIWSRFTTTLLLSFLAIVFASVVSLSLAVLDVRYRSRAFSAFLEGLTLITASTPRIVLSIIALLIMLQLSISAASAGNFGWFQLLAASIVLALPLISLFLAQLREGFSGVMDEDFIRLARAKGLAEWHVIVRHALRAAINPFLSIVGLCFGALLGGSVIVETVLGLPGIGALMVAAVRGRDVPLVMGIVLLTSVSVWVANLAAELLQILNDRRLRDGAID